MKRRSVFERLCSIEVLAGALAGAILPYVVAVAIKVAPTRVPIGLVAVSVGGGALLGWASLSAARVRRRKRQAALEQKERESEELKAQLQRIELALKNIRVRRRAWPIKRKSQTHS